MCAAGVDDGLDVLEMLLEFVDPCCSSGTPKANEEVKSNDKVADRCGDHHGFGGVSQFGRSCMFDERRVYLCTSHYARDMLNRTDQSRVITSHPAMRRKPTSHGICPWRRCAGCSTDGTSSPICLESASCGAESRIANPSSALYTERPPTRIVRPLETPQ